MKDLGLEPLVSLSDHDNIEASLHLRMLGPTRDVPISVEWTVPYEETIFHIGVHNLPPARDYLLDDGLCAVHRQA